MSNTPIFNIPNTRGTELPPLSLHTKFNDSNDNVNDKKKPKRKPPPIDFLRINGSFSYDSPSYYKESSDSIESRESNPIILSIQTNSLSSNPSTTSNHEALASVDLFGKNLQDLTSEEWQFLADNNHIKEINKLGEGNGGSVSKCRLSKGDQIFALKLITTDSNPDIQKQILRELQYNRLCDSDNIVKYYGTFIIQDHSMIGITMEFMGGKSLDAIYKRVIEIDPSNRINEKVLGKIAESILKGLNYLHQQKIIHRDIKPSNILLDTEGNIKLCDFGVSGEVVNSLATTFVGTQYYMAPERIMGKPYTVNCDVWSLGLTLLEVATGKFPFENINSEDKVVLGPIELLSLILEYEPKLADLPEENILWSDSFKNFVHFCLKKNIEERPSPRQMLQHPWIKAQQNVRVRMDKFVKQLWDDL